MPLYNPPVASVTKRVSLSLWGSGRSGSRSDVTDMCQRLLLALPVTTTQWRIRMRNSDAQGTAGTGVLSVAGFWIGNPTIPSSGAWAGAFASSPTQALTSFSTASDGSEYTSSWVTDPAAQFTKGTLYGLSMGLTCTLGTVFRYQTVGGIYSLAAGASAAAGSASAPSSPQNFAGYMDIRLEYEFVTTNGVAVVAFIGDSLMDGTTYNEGNGAWPHEGIAGSAGLRNGFCWTNLGVGGTKIADWGGATSAYQWTRNDLVTTVPDAAVILLGTNDGLSSTALATMKSGIRTVISNVTSLGIPRGRIFLVTVPNANLTSTNESNRLAFNTELTYPIAGTCGGVIDADKVIGADTDYLPTGGGVHLTHRGYQRIAHLIGPIVRN